MPPIRLLAAVLAAGGVSYVLVGSAGLHLRGHCRPVGDIDAVPAPDQGNLERLHDVLTDLAVGSKCSASAPVNYFGSCPGADELWPGGLPAGRGRRLRLSPGSDPVAVRERLREIDGITWSSAWQFPAPVAKSLHSWTERHRPQRLILAVPLLAHDPDSCPLASAR